MLRVQTEAAFVLHSRAYRDSSLIVDVLTRVYGRIALVARSARGLQSRYRGKLQCFSPLLMSYAGRNELKSLSALETSGRPYQLHGNRLLCGFYLNELLVKLWHKEDPSPLIYELYDNALLQLESASTVQATLRIFEKRLLSLLGYGFSFDYTCDSNEAIVPTARYRLLMDQGFVRIEKNFVSSLVFSGQSLLDYSTEQLSSTASLHDAKRLMRQVISSRLEGRVLNTRDLF